MGKFTVYQSNKCITSQKLRSRRPHRVASTQLMENPRIFAPSPRHQEPKTASPAFSVRSVDTSPTIQPSFPEPRLDICPVPPAGIEG
jgi:hypothetical protein